MLRCTSVFLCAAVLVSCTGDVGGTDSVPQVDPLLAAQSGLRRLSQAELDNTLRDLVGDTTAPASRLLLEDEFAPYDNNYRLQQASGALIDALQALAEDVAQRTLADASARNQLVPCTPASPSDATCFRSFLDGFLPRAFRRAVTEPDVAPYAALLSFATEQNDFYFAVELAIRAVIQDPEFLYRIEKGTATSTPGVFGLSADEIASRMSYLLWGTMPDDALRAAADDGSLTTASGRRAQAERMLGDPRARPQMHRFHAMWLGYRAIPHSADLVAAFGNETSALIDDVIFDTPGDYMRLFTADQTYVDDMLADHYGLPRPSGGEGWVPYADTGRAGILGHGSLLAAFSKFSDTSPTQRGIMIRTRLMCQDIPPPPPTIDVDQPPGGVMDARCKYDRYAEHRDQSTSCAGCHSLMDPIGFGLENFDIAGRYREHDDGAPECIIEGQGEITELGTFSGPAELSAMLVDGGFVDGCAIKQFITFALGREPEDFENGLVDELTETFRTGDRDLRAFIVEFVASERFARRAEEAP